jgi:hypothetical protein
MSDIDFPVAKREDTAIVLALAGASGSGKTMSALELAVGLAGDKDILLIDSEGRRGLHYADDYTFRHYEWRPPYEPAALGKLLSEASGCGFGAVIVDSMSDEHEGEGGLADMAEAALQEQIKKGWEPNSASAWAKPKAEHKKNIVRWLRNARCHVIFCLRAQEKVLFESVVEGGRRRTRVIPIGWTPVCEKNLLFDVTTSLLFTPDRPGYPKPIKLYDKHRPFFPEDKQVSREAGARLAEWARGAVRPQLDLPALLDLGDLAARQGSRRLEQWWTKQLTKELRRQLEGYLPSWKGIASVADKELGAELLGDNAVVNPSEPSSDPVGAGASD